jgi:hypothetical protein
MTSRLAILPLTVAVVAISSLVVMTGARAHVADSGMVYPTWCCNSAKTSPTGDCAPISDRFISERLDGYHITIPAGGHPQLKTKSYSAVVPYDQAKKSDDGQPHICLAYEGTSRFCFFMPPKLG